MLLPASIPAETIVIKAGVPLQPTLHSDVYIRQIKSLLRDIASGTVPPGYESSLITGGREECPVKECSFGTTAVHDWVFRWSTGFSLNSLHAKAWTPTSIPAQS